MSKAPVVAKSWLDPFSHFLSEVTKTIKPTCEPTTHRLAKMYREPTTHRLHEGRAKPPLFAGELPVPRARSGTRRSLGCFPITVTSVGAIAKMVENSGLPAVAHMRRKPRETSRPRLPQPPRVARQAVGTDTNLHDALSVPDAESSTMRCRKNLYDALSVRS